MGEGIGVWLGEGVTVGTGALVEACAGAGVGVDPRVNGLGDGAEEGAEAGVVVDVGRTSGATGGDVHAVAAISAAAIDNLVLPFICKNQNSKAF